MIGRVCLVLALLSVVAHAITPAAPPILYPRDTETRETKQLNGIWSFKTESYTGQGLAEAWSSSPLPPPTIPMPVPSSYNDITQDFSLREYVGWAWYQTEAYVPSSWASLRTVLRVDSASYFSVVWINGVSVMQHEGGHLPFETDVSQMVGFGKANLITIAVNNTLNDTTLPPGVIVWYNNSTWPPHPPGYHVLTYPFDWFNYAGIDRSVWLYSTPKTFVADITVRTNCSTEGAAATVSLALAAAGQGPNDSSLSFSVLLLDAGGVMVSQFVGPISADEILLRVANASLWWPNGYGAPYLYTLQISILNDSSLVDVYRLKVGLRTVQVTSSAFLINGEPFYFRGVNKHEDSDIRGKGLDLALIAKDFNLLNWMNVNAFRTSHYPYAEEIMDFADSNGIVVIDESPACEMQPQNFNPGSLAHHLYVLQEMWQRDKNRPSVIMWSLANEPATSSPNAHGYFAPLVQLMHALDYRPVTFTADDMFQEDQAAMLMDVLCVNRYFAWYSDPGALSLVNYQLTADLTGWHEKFGKLVICSEFGADTMEGVHIDPPLMFSQEFQVAFLQQYHAAFDQLRAQGWLIGELPWNFADFATEQSDVRVGGLNRKGLFTRQRQPKAAAFTVQARYASLKAKASDGSLYE